MQTLTGQTLLLISQIRSFEKSIKFSAYILYRAKWELYGNSTILYFSISKLQTCNWTVTTEEQISPVVNLESWAKLNFCKCSKFQILLKLFWKPISISLLRHLVSYLFRFPLSSSDQQWVFFAKPQAATGTRLGSQGSFEKAASFISGNTSSRNLNSQKI